MGFVKMAKWNAVYIFRDLHVGQISRGWSLFILIGFCILDPQAIKKQLKIYALEETLSLVAPELRIFFCFSLASDWVRMIPAVCKVIFRMEPGN